MFTANLERSHVRIYAIYFSSCTNQHYLKRYINSHWNIISTHDFIIQRSAPAAEACVRSRLLYRQYCEQSQPIIGQTLTARTHTWRHACKRFGPHYAHYACQLSSTDRSQCTHDDGNKHIQSAAAAPRKLSNCSWSGRNQNVDCLLEVIYRKHRNRGQCLHFAGDSERAPANWWCPDRRCLHVQFTETLQAGRPPDRPRKQTNKSALARWNTNQ